ncbi:MAG: hypothetical protein AB7P04_12540 [Bacteriovoracia bacterium]
MKTADKVKFVISDCHLSAGRFFEGHLNPHEDFYFDDDMCDLFEFFSTGDYGVGPNGPVDVELVIDGDYFDFLNVPYHGEFEDAVSEEIALYKVDAIIKGHPKVMASLRRFAAKPNKRITYLIGNHDADLCFEKVRERIVREWDPEGQYPSEKVRVVADTDRLTYPEGVEIRHGNQLEAGNEIDFENPFVISPRGEKLLNLPWGSIYVLKIINRMKWEREYLDKIRPIKVFVVVGLLFDTWFTLRFTFLSTLYFLKTRFSWHELRRFSVRRFFEVVRDEATFFQDLERAARKILDDQKNLKTLIMGHTHRPMDKIYPDGKQYINTGTWTKMIDLDWRGLGQQYRRTFALVHIRDGRAECELRQWVGEHSPHKIYNS